jgi:hypothetical protein
MYAKTAYIYRYDYKKKAIKQKFYQFIVSYNYV